MNVRKPSLSAECRLRVRMSVYVHVGSLAFCLLFNAKCASDSVTQKLIFCFLCHLIQGTPLFTPHRPMAWMDKRTRRESQNCCLDIRRHSRDAKPHFYPPFLLGLCLLCRHRSQSQFKCDYNKTPNRRKKKAVRRIRTRETPE